MSKFFSSSDSFSVSYKNYKNSLYNTRNILYFHKCLLELKGLYRAPSRFTLPFCTLFGKDLNPSPICRRSNARRASGREERNAWPTVWRATGHPTRQNLPARAKSPESFAAISRVASTESLERQKRLALWRWS